MLQKIDYIDAGYYFCKVSNGIGDSLSAVAGVQIKGITLKVYSLKILRPDFKMCKDFSIISL